MKSLFSSTKILRNSIFESYMRREANSYQLAINCLKHYFYLKLRKYDIYYLLMQHGLYLFIDYYYTCTYNCLHLPPSPLSLSLSPSPNVTKYYV